MVPRRIVILALIFELGSAATSRVDSDDNTVVEPSVVATEHRSDCTVSWVSLRDPRKVTVEAFVHIIKNPLFPLHNMRIVRIKPLEYTPKIEPLEKTSGEDIADLLDSEMVSALRDKPVPDYMGNKTFCERALKVFGDYLYKRSGRYRYDAMSLGIMPGSDSFIAWSILNLKLERNYTRHFNSPSLSKWGCSVKEEICVVDKRTKKKSSMHKTQEVTISAGYVFGRKSVDVSQFTTKKKQKSDNDVVARLNKDLRSLPHFVTTENAPNLESPSGVCRYYLLFKAWELDQMISGFLHSPPISLCPEHEGSTDAKVCLTYLRWRECDEIRQNGEEEAIKRGEDAALRSSAGGSKTRCTML
ncbi:hypothetical protein FOZ61_004481 [Perkinsus olseni]|uniref:Uncharacterized protein n=2 Tax=Perkinsus olseni TaxID=32597 RepID=A0A7J6LKK0_PEROL|nr:hypothetical protein FOZ61_004481 [Perkinsus olseni]